jgi:type IV secretion system protein VirB4
MDPVSILLGGLAGTTATAVVGRNREHRTEPRGLSDLLNWAFLVGDGVVLQKDGALVAAFRYRGPDLASATAADVNALGSQLNDALLPFTDGWMFHVDAIRSPAKAYPPSEFPDQVTTWIDAERRAVFQSSRAQFVSDYVLSVTYSPPRELYARAASVFLQGSPKGMDWPHVVSSFEHAMATLHARLRSRLSVERLGSDELITHLHHCLTALPHTVSAPEHGAYLNTLLASQELVGGFSPRVGNLHLRVIAIVGYPNASSLGRLDFLNALPLAYRWSNRFIPVGQQAAAKLIRRHQQRWFMGRRGVGSFLREMGGGKDGGASVRQQEREEEFFYDRAATQMARDAGDAAAENAAGGVRFGFTTQLVVVAEPNAGDADDNARQVLTALRDHGFPARIETVNALDAFFGSLPGHGYQNLRRPLLSSANVVDLWPITSVWPGLSTNPSQFFPADTPPLLHVATDGSTPFRLTLHVRDVGHTLLVGATGAGKSTFVGLVCAQWRRYSASRVVVFDVGYSHWLLARAVGGAHYDLGTGPIGRDRPVSDNCPGDIGLQPLADVDQITERSWAAAWLETLFEFQGVELTPQRRSRIEHALSLLAEQLQPFRTLTELTVHLQEPELVSALKPYTVAGQFGRLLDATADSITARELNDRSERDGSYQVFELRHLMEMDDKILIPVLLYLFRRVERQLDGHPTLIVIEELWAPLMRTVFANRIKQWLLTLRKQNAAVMLVAHTPAQLDTVAGKQILIESCPTRVLLPNSDAGSTANAPLYRDLGLNDREIAALARAVPKRDYYVKSPLGSRLVRLDLGPTALAFLSTPEGVTADGLRPTVEALAERHGQRWPAEWLSQRGRSTTTR